MIYFFLNNSFFLLFLIIFFTNIFPLYSIYFGLLLLPLILLKTKLSLHLNISFIILTLFSLFYSFITAWHGLTEGLMIVIYLIYPPMFYILGRYFYVNFKEDILLIYFMLAFSIAAITIVDVFSDIYSNGLINLSRNLDVDENRDIVATLRGVKVSLAVSFIGLIFTYPKNVIERKYQKYFIIFSCFSLVTVIHLVNRTGVVLAVISFIAVIIFNFKTVGLKKYIMLFIFVISSSFFIKPIINISEAIDAYSERTDAIGNETNTAGGRFENWKTGIETLTKQPMGGGVYQEGGRRFYAHNLWLDINEMAGVIPFFLFIIFTLINVKNNLVIIHRNNEITPLQRSLIIVLNIGFFLTCFVEPIIEGDYIYFCAYMLFWGMTSIMYNETVRHNNVVHANILS